MNGVQSWVLLWGMYPNMHPQHSTTVAGERSPGPSDVRAGHSLGLDTARSEGQSRMQGGGQAGLMLKGLMPRCRGVPSPLAWALGGSLAWSRRERCASAGKQ